MEWRSDHNILLPYFSALNYMELRVEQVIRGEASELIWFLEHDPVYTAGSGSQPEEFLLDTGVPVVAASRGGKYTYHGPGQRVIYVILNLRARGLGIHDLISKLQQSIINSIFEVTTISARTILGLIGVWVQDPPRKLAALGLRIKSGVSYHGVAININNNLEPYKNIIPCGIKEYQVTSLKECWKRDIYVSCLDEALRYNLAQAFNYS